MLQDTLRIPSPMQHATLANKITIARICLIPLFAVAAAEYAESERQSDPRELFRWLAIIGFALAAITDGLDGFVARHFHQKTKLGAILDPMADKGLIFTAMLIFMLYRWPNGFPVWFPLVIIGRDLILGVGFLLLSGSIPEVEIRPTWIGKAATLFQILAVLLVLFSTPPNYLMYAIIPAAILTLISGAQYLVDGIRQGLAKHR